ncbi:unnamed protein product [Dovyalis caffra]|uniref:Uncharacterized protein n=1 Tax=Dovyalis caffra TaxID=77055 RepID=A0AAV1S417_9ROSI|nr:unnamed protein product [Dovyalis caffra]
MTSSHGSLVFPRKLVEKYTRKPHGIQVSQRAQHLLGQRNNTTTIDFINLLHICASDSPNPVLVPKELDLKGMKNYGVLSRAMKISLEAKNKRGFFIEPVKN